MTVNTGDSWSAEGFRVEGEQLVLRFLRSLFTSLSLKEIDFDVLWEGSDVGEQVSDWPDGSRAVPLGAFTPEYFSPRTRPIGGGDLVSHQKGSGTSPYFAQTFSPPDSPC